MVQYLETHPKLTYVHVLGRKHGIMNSGYMEYGWTNSSVGVYIRDLVKNVLDDVGVPSDIYISSLGEATQAVIPAYIPADALVIDLSRIDLR